MRISPISFAGKTTRSAYARKTTPSSTSNSVAEASTRASEEKIVQYATDFVNAFNNLRKATQGEEESTTAEQGFYHDTSDMGTREKFACPCYC